MAHALLRLPQSSSIPLTHTITSSYPASDIKTAHPSLSLPGSTLQPIILLPPPTQFKLSLPFIPHHFTPCLGLVKPFHPPHIPAHLFPQRIYIHPVPLLRPLNDQVPAEQVRVLERVHGTLRFGVRCEFAERETAAGLRAGGCEGGLAREAKGFEGAVCA